MDDASVLPMSKVSVTSTASRSVTQQRRTRRAFIGGPIVFTSRYWRVTRGATTPLNLKLHSPIVLRRRFGRPNVVTGTVRGVCSWACSPRCMFSPFRAIGQSGTGDQHAHHDHHEDRKPGQQEITLGRIAGSRQEACRLTPRSRRNARLAIA